MKIQQEIEFVITTKAVLREGQLTLTVTVAAPYGQRHASETLETFPEPITTQVEAALKAAVQHALQTDLIVQATNQAHTARQIAGIRGEAV